MIVFIFNSCGKDEVATNNQVIDVVIKTNTVEHDNLSDVILYGQIEDPGNNEVRRRGFCWGTEDNPTKLNSNYIEDFSTSVGSMTQKVEGKFEPNKLYYVRAYFENSNGKLFYGNTVLFEMKPDLRFLNVTEITLTNAILNATYSGDNSYSVGFVFSETPNPTIQNSIDFFNAYSSGTNKFSASLKILKPNTKYYARFFKEKMNKYSYSENFEFTTVGYSGKAGGSVIYDKGELTNGWRYIELQPNKINNTTYEWGCKGTFISGTSDAIGLGRENTNLVLAKCNTPGTAAKISKDYNYSGFTDWFIPSEIESKLVFDFLKYKNVQYINFWTSTEVNSDDAVIISQDITKNFIKYNTSKDYKEFVYLVRRY